MSKNERCFVLVSLTDFLLLTESSMERDKFMSPADAKEFGIIDKILDHPPKHGEKTTGASEATEKPTVTATL